MNEDKRINQERISPSQFMRLSQPEYYSDTEKDQVDYVLDRAVFEYHLDTITVRNETQGFEVFCRKLCERTICPNLRSHTGPDGGGDSKVDTETYPVSDEIAGSFYIGETKSGSERWAFAFSANKDWKRKVEDDVRKITEIERTYKQIVFVTNRPVKDSLRSKVEDSLSKEYGIPVTIHDRLWIVQEIIDNNRKDLAFNYLKVGEENTNPHRLGPKDYSRLKQLEDIESDLAKSETCKGMERQRVMDSLLAAKLSRNLERPRNETDGRFLRAIRYAEAYGSRRQKLEAGYEHIWTSIFWFDDFDPLKKGYEDFETMTLQSEQAIEFDSLCNLLHALFIGTAHDYLDPVECKLEERAATLQQKLETMVNVKDRPNSAAEAELSLIRVRVIQASANPIPEQLLDIQKDLSNLLKRAGGLGEFRANRLEETIHAVGQAVGNDPAYNALVEQAAEFFSKRKGDVEAARILLNRAEQLGLDENFEIIRLLGKASVKLVKKEHSELLVQAMQRLMLAYRSAGMLWAARASCITLAATLIAESEEKGQISPNFVPTMKIWGWLALQLGNLPDFLFSAQMLNVVINSSALTDESKIKIQEDLTGLDSALGCLFLNLDEKELKKLAAAPDAIKSRGLFFAYCSLLYTFGCEDVLRAEGSIPEGETEEEVNQNFSSLYSQPVREDLSRSLNLNDGGLQRFQTILLGMQAEIHFDAGKTSSIVKAQVVMASLEAFFSTTLEQQISPHWERLFIFLETVEGSGKPSFEIDTAKMEGVIKWPENLSVRNFENQADVHKFLGEICYKVLAAAFLINDLDNLLEKLHTNEEVHQRIMMVISSFSSFGRVTRKEALKLSDWQSSIKNTYELKSKRPVLQKIKFSDEEKADSGNNAATGFVPPKITDHRAVKIRSIFDIHAWNQAKWRGAIHYMSPIQNQPPCMALIFENEAEARKIFEGWRERFGSKDEDDEIYILIIRNLPKQNKHHYRLLISSKPPDVKDMDLGAAIFTPSRSVVMRPNSNGDLEKFLQLYRNAGSYYLAPAILMSGEQQLKLLSDVFMLKKALTVKPASEVKWPDVESMSLGTPVLDEPE